MKNFKRSELDYDSDEGSNLNTVITTYDECLKLEKIKQNKKNIKKDLEEKETTGLPHIKSGSDNDLENKETTGLPHIISGSDNDISDISSPGSKKVIDKKNDIFEDDGWHEPLVKKEVLKSEEKMIISENVFIKSSSMTMKKEISYYNEKHEELDEYEELNNNIINEKQNDDILNEYQIEKCNNIISNVLDDIDYNKNFSQIFKFYKGGFESNVINDDKQSERMISIIKNNINAQGFDIVSKTQSYYSKVLECLQCKNENFKFFTSKRYDIVPYFLAGTGTGKTLFFTALSLASINPLNNVTQSIIIAPTRLLAIQLFDEIKKILKNSGLSLGLHIGSGGEKKNDKERKVQNKRYTTYMCNLPINEKEQLFSHGKTKSFKNTSSNSNIGINDHIIVATQGKLLNLINSYTENRSMSIFLDDKNNKRKIDIVPNFKHIKSIVFDEADKTLDDTNNTNVQGSGIIMPFLKKKKCKILLCSATFNENNFLGTKERFESDDFKSLVHIVNTSEVKNNIKHILISTEETKRISFAKMIIKNIVGNVLVFFIGNDNVVDKELEAENFCKNLENENISNYLINKKLTSDEEIKVDNIIKENGYRVIVTTSNTLVRGINFNVKHCFYIGFPKSADDYVHASGRCGRNLMNSEEGCFSFLVVSKEDEDRYRYIYDELKSREIPITFRHLLNDGKVVKSLSKEFLP